MPVEIQIQSKELVDLVEQFNAIDAKKLERAMKRAARKAARWVSTRTIRAVSKETRIQQKVIRNRRKNARGGKTGVWLGLNPVGVGRLNPKQTKTGVRAARQTYTGAFILPSGAVAVREGRARLPIATLRIPIYDRGIAAAEDLRDGGSEEFEREFERLLTVELAGGF